MTTKQCMMAAAVIVLAVVGCGGKVLVDGLPVGEGGAGGTGASTSTGHGGGGMTCSNPPDPAKLKSCNASATAGSGGDPSCDTNWCDGNQNTYAAKCQGTVCHCLLNGAEKCTCVLNGAGKFCTAGISDCCPWGP